MLACHSEFSRGSGMGNRLWPWARAVIYSSRHNLQMIWPTWPRLSPTVLLKGGIDIHNYHRQILLFDVFQPPRNSITGLTKLALLARAERLPEPAALDDPPSAGSGRDSIITFSGERGQFRELYGMNGLVLTALRQMAKPKWRRLAERNSGALIGVNIRRGKDFHDAVHPSDFLLKGALRTPLSWFRQCIVHIRAILGFSAPVIVTSDGTASDLGEILALDNVKLLRPGCAISDLLVLARTKILIGSGGSSFSGWASYLGNMPTITIPGQSLTWFKLTHSNSAFIGEYDPFAPNSEFDQQVAELVKA